MKQMILMLAIAGCAAQPAAPVTPNNPVVQLAARRAQLIGWLHAYMEAGSYPADRDGNPASVFVDPNGRRCPMAELIHKTGRDDLVAAVAREANTIRLADVHAGPLHDWILASGLTQEEIAMVQGVMEVELSPADREQLGRRELQLAVAKAEIRGRLETAEVALRQATATGLVTATSRLPAIPSALIATPIRGAVIVAR